MLYFPKHSTSSLKLSDIVVMALCLKAFQLPLGHNHTNYPLAVSILFCYLPVWRQISSLNYPRN